MQQKFSKMFKAVFLSLFLILLSFSTVSAETVPVYIYGINHPEDWKGKIFSMNGGNYWAGEIHIQFNGTPPSGNHTRAYCMEYDSIIRPGRTYRYELMDVPDNSTWRAVSYVLSWYDPPKNDSEASAVQGAIWGLLGGHDPSGYNGSLVLEAKGKDVVRAGDKLFWVNPPSIMGAGESVTLKVKLTAENGTARPNVRVKFNVTGGTLDRTEAFTDQNGEATVTLTAPPESGTVIEVKAWTRGVWPKKYLGIENYQDLIGLGDALGLTATTELCVLIRIHVVPEVPLGTITVVAAFSLAFVFKKKFTVHN